VRMLLSRMQHKGDLQSRRLGRRSFFRLGEHGQRQVQWGGGQAFNNERTTWDGRWTMVEYSIPEVQRSKRDLLRRSLAWYGFGPLSTGLWISPHAFPEQAQKKWQELGLWDYLKVFRADFIHPNPDASLVQRTWSDLPRLNERYQQYIVKWELTLEKLVPEPVDNLLAFASRMRALGEYITLRLEDPILPPELLPEVWLQPKAQAIFQGLYQALSEPAKLFFDSVFVSAPENSNP